MAYDVRDGLILPTSKGSTMASVGSISVAQVAISLMTGAPSTTRFTFAPRGKKKKVIFTNTGANAVFIGTSAVTSSAYGFSLAAAGVSPVLEVAEGDSLYAIATTGTNVVKALWLT